MAVIDLKNATIKIKGAGVSEEIEVKLGNGNLTYDEKVIREYIKDRGLLDTVRDGDEEPMDVRIDAQWEKLTGGAGPSGTPTVEDALKQRGPASDWESTSADECEPYCVDIEIVNAPPCGEAGEETILLPEFRYESINHDMRGGTLAIVGKCNAKEATVTPGDVGT